MKKTHENTINISNSYSQRSMSNIYLNLFFKNLLPSLTIQSNTFFIVTKEKKRLCFGVARETTC